MADNKVLIEFQIVEKGGKISAVAKDTEKLSKSQDKAAKSQKNLTKQQDMGYGRQKQGLVQTANSTKNFSKLANTIDGGGNGLVQIVLLVPHQWPSDDDARIAHIAQTAVLGNMAKGGADEHLEVSAVAKQLACDCRNAL